jgi:methionyl-tRNA formyltransferase
MTMSDMSLKRIIIAGGGSPLVKLVKMVKDAPDYKTIEIAAVFVPEVEIDFFRNSLSNHPSLPVEAISYLERGKFNHHRLLNNCDYLISFNNMFLIDDKVIELFRHGGMNYHAGSLPEYAGSYTYQWAIRNHEKTFASSIHWMEGKADAGPIICKRDFPLSPRETGLSILIKCTNAALEMMTELLRDIDSNRPLPRIPQDLSKRKFYSLNNIKNAGFIDWNSKAEDIESLVRAADFSPMPSPTYEPYTKTRLGVMKVLKASFGKGQHSSKPGTAIHIGEDGIEVATGSARSLLLTSIVIEGRKYTLAKMPDSGLNVGDYFSG